MKDKLVFDTTDADSIAASDKVGAYLVASDGTLLTHTDVGGKKALDVRIAEGINVEVDLDAADDSVAAYLNDGAGNAISSTGGAIHISDGGGSLTVDGTVAATQSGTWNIDTVTTLTGITNDVNIADGGNSITVDAVQLDIDDLNATDDAVSAHMKDGAGTALTSTLVGADQALDVNIVQAVDPSVSNTAIATASTDLTAANTAEDIVASPLANRKEVFVYNNDNRIMYIGQSGVSASTGFPVSPGAYLPLKAGASVDIEFVSSKLNHNIRTLELS